MEDATKNLLFWAAQDIIQEEKIHFFSAGEGEKRAGGVCQFVRKMPVYMKIAVWFLKKIGPDKDGRCWHFI